MQTVGGDKILTPLKGVPVVVYTWRAFITCGVVDRIVMAYRDEEQRAELERMFTQWTAPPAGIESVWVKGGRERQDSVLAALEKVAERAPEIVLIHDCARPLADTVKELPEDFAATRTLKLRTLDRGRLWSTETPQGFSYPLILDAYRRVAAEGTTVTDDVAAASACGHPVSLLRNSYCNHKLTVPEDFPLLEAMLETASTDR
jgi:2-C-methyl-D-erythritol 4-phosphate cytidylyltransferase